MRSVKSISPLTLALLLLLAMIVVTLNITTEVQARPLAGFNPQPTSQSGPPKDKPPDDDDDEDNDNGDDAGDHDDGSEDDDDEDQDDDDNGDHDDGSEDDDDEDQDDDDDGGDHDDGSEDDNEDTPQPSPPDNTPADDDEEENEATDTSTPQDVVSPLVDGDPGPASDRGVQPVYVEGNPQGGDPPTNCGAFGDYREFRIGPLDDLGSGHYSDGFLSLDIVVTLSETDGPSFDWSIAADSAVDALEGIFVKGGPNGNWYDYSGFTDVSDGGATFDGFLHSPINPANGKFFGLSHVSFCYLLTSNGDSDADGIHDSEGDDGSAIGAPMDSAVNGATGDSKPGFLPETGTEQFWPYSEIALLLIICGSNLAVVGGLFVMNRAEDPSIHEQDR